jgi:hypothetical protein
MTFSVNNIAESIAQHLAPIFPDVTFYQDPNQQDTETPCMFIQQMYSNIAIETGGFFLRTIGVDLTYLVDYNLPNLQELYQAAAETLDLNLETFMHGGKEIRTHNRKWNIDLDALHYKLELVERVYIPREETPMTNIEYHEAVKNG